MASNDLSDFDISKPLWDQNTFSGRLKHYFWVTDPRTITTSTAKLLEAKQIVENYKYVQWSLDNSNCRGPPKSLSYKKFEL